MQSPLRIFRQTFEQFVRKGELIPLPSNLPTTLSRPEPGIYVAAFENPGRKPRGRVGSYLPVKSTLAEEIQAQAENLARTFPFRKEDLPFLEYEIFLTKAPHLLSDISELPDDAGLLVRTSKGASGVSLPSPQKRKPTERLSDACRQGNIDPHMENARLYTFAIEVLSEASS